MPERRLGVQALAGLIYLYGEAAGREIFDRLSVLTDRYLALIPSPGGPAPRTLTERDAILITYADQVKEPGAPPLQTLADFCQAHLAGLVSAVHILPFYPSSSDDGFSVIDYRAVDPTLGDWSDVLRVAKHFKLMFDAVINHVSAQGKWFQAFLQDDPNYREYFIAVEGSPDLSSVVRPRTHPLLTKFLTPSGRKAVWTTCSADQVDLNYRNPEVLLEVIETLLFYVSRGASFLRLDAIAYLWKEVGTPCIHLPQTHRIVRLFRAVLDAVAPHVRLITETNVSHAENLSYYGDGTDEAHLVYNFALPPLVLHALQTGKARTLSAWASDLQLPSNQVSFFNFLASHDGIGLNPARGILNDVEIEELVDQTQAHGGLVSYKRNPDGSQSPYELNINFFDALSDPRSSESADTQVSRFMAAQAILLALAGVPGIYFHSLFGSRGWPEGVAVTGRSRTINRQKLLRRDLEAQLAEPGSLRFQVFQAYTVLLRTRGAHPAFHPGGSQVVLRLNPAVFSLLRVAPGGAEHILCLHNVSGQTQSVYVGPEQAGLPAVAVLKDLIAGEELAVPTRSVPLEIRLAPYQVAWLLLRQDRFATSC